MRQQEDAEVSGQFAGTNMVASQYPSTYTLWTLRLHHPKLDIPKKSGTQVSENISYRQPKHLQRYKLLSHIYFLIAGCILGRPKTKLTSSS
jgi:hypothetical protein